MPKTWLLPYVALYCTKLLTKLPVSSPPLASVSRGLGLELHTCQLWPLPTVKAFTPAALMNWVPANTILPLFVVMPCPLISVSVAVLAIVTLPEALIRPTANTTLFFIVKALMVDPAPVAKVLMVLLALLKVTLPVPPRVIP